MIGTDAKTDIALLKINVSGLPVVPWGDSSQLKLGEWVLAIGSPFQLNQTVTAGIISATGRTNLGFADYEDFIQTDAAINPGNSGGALINTRGELVGINTGIFSQSGGYQGIGFAIPSKLARHIVDELMKNGEVRRGAIGYLKVDNLTTQLAEDVHAPNTQGAIIVEMQRNSPTYEAGLRPGDVIVGFNGQTVTDASQFNRMVGDAQHRDDGDAEGDARRPSDRDQDRDRVERRARRSPAAFRTSSSNSLNARLKRTGAPQPAFQHFARLVAVAGHADDDRLVAPDDAALHEIDRRGERRAAGRLGEDAFGFREQLNRVDDLRVADRRAAAARLADRLDHLITVGGVANRDRLGDRVRPHRLGMLEAGCERVHDRRAPGRLRRVDARQRRRRPGRSASARGIRARCAAAACRRRPGETT